MTRGAFGTRTAWLVIALALAAGSCARASHTRIKPVSIDSRPTPPQPVPEAPSASPAGSQATVPRETARPQPPARQVPVLRARIVADTLAAREVLTRCARRHLLAGEEGTVESATRLLVDTRRALLDDDITRAESLARQALQLTRSLACP